MLDYYVCDTLRNRVSTSLRFIMLAIIARSAFSLYVFLFYISCAWRNLRETRESVTRILLLFGLIGNYTVSHTKDLVKWPFVAESGSI